MWRIQIHFFELLSVTFVLKAGSSKRFTSIDDPSRTAWDKTGSLSTEWVEKVKQAGIQ